MDEEQPKLVDSSTLEIGSLVTYGGALALVTYHQSPLHLCYLSPLHPGHGYTAPMSVSKVASHGKFDLIAVKKGAIPQNDMWGIITAERLREIATGVGTTSRSSGAVSSNGHVHWCRNCGPCGCYKGRKVRL